MTKASFVDESYLPNVKTWSEYYRAKVGFRNYWYAACLSTEIADGDWLARTILGEEILFRRINGKVHAIKDRCIHRGVKLSNRVECHTDSTITCWWHGFTFRWTDGAVTNIVGAPESKLIGRAKIKVYPVDEAQGMVFVFIGDPGIDVPPLSNHVPPMFLDEGRVIEGEVLVVESNWRLGPEGGLDEIHRYLHRTSTLLLETKATMPLGYRGAKTQCEIVDGEAWPKGIIDRFASDTMYFEVDIDTAPGAVTGVRFADTGTKKKRTVATSSWLPGVLRVEGFPEDGGCFFEFYVPINETQHRCFMMISQTCRTPQEAAQFRSRYKTRWRRYAVQNFLRQDVDARESAGRFYQHDRAWIEEILTEEDYMIIEWRKLSSRHSKGVQTPDHIA
jgi:carbazole 1,9a-dioxygenase terminal dioxygenase component